jgi:hypothetical protein
VCTEDQRDVSGLRASGGQRLVVPTQTAGFPYLNHFANLRHLRRPPLRAVHLQGLVAAPAVIVGEVIVEDSSQVQLTGYHDPASIMDQNDQ